MRCFGNRPSVCLRPFARKRLPQAWGGGIYINIEQTYEAIARATVAETAWPGKLKVSLFYMNANGLKRP